MTVAKNLAVTIDRMGETYCEQQMVFLVFIIKTDGQPREASFSFMEVGGLYLDGGDDNSADDNYGPNDSAGDVSLAKYVADSRNGDAGPGRLLFG